MMQRKPYVLSSSRIRKRTEKSEQVREDFGSEGKNKETQWKRPQKESLPSYRILEGTPRLSLLPYPFPSVVP